MVVTLTGKGNFIFGPADLSWVWSGKVNNDWHNPLNWQLLNHSFINGVPVATNNVIIPSDAILMPVVSLVNPAICHDLTIRPGASLTIDSLKFLTVEGNLIMEAE